ATWTEVSQTFPPRIEHAMAYDPLARVVHMFGGLALFDATVYNDTWVWDGGEWQRQYLSLEPPPVTTATAMVYVATQHAAMMFGAPTGTGDTWILRYRLTTSGAMDERCELDADADGDGARSCADIDCWPSCTPQCPPEASCAPSAPHCGD